MEFNSVSSQRSIEQKRNENLAKKSKIYPEGDIRHAKKIPKSPVISEAVRYFYLDKKRARSFGLESQRIFFNVIENQGFTRDSTV